MSLFVELKRRNVFRVGIAYGVAAWLLIQIADTVFPRIGLSESAVTLVIAMLGIGFVPALIFAWAFELTPEGIKRERDVDRAQSITPQTGKKLDRVIIGILAVVVAWFLFDEFYVEPGAQNVGPSVAEGGQPATAAGGAPAGMGQKSIAVLPFVNMSADAENEYFSDGIAEELLNVLVRVSALDVASRTSSFAYKGKDLPLSQIARELGVNHILEGSVRKSGNRVRITAQLINAGTDRHLWSDTYERELDDIFDIQEEISNAIVDELKVALNVDERRAISRAQHPTENTEAYELYLQGRFKWRQRLEDNIRTSITLFERAIKLDPDFAKAHEALASAYAVLPAWSGALVGEALPQADQHAARALELDASLAEARAVRAHHAVFEKRWQDAYREFELALEFEPRNGGVRQWYAEVLASAGYLRAALEQIELAYELDPASPVINNVYTSIASLAGEDELAIRHMQFALDLGIPFAALVGAESLARQGDWARIERLVYPLIEQYPEVPPVLKLCLEAIRDPSLAPQLRSELGALDDARGGVLCAARAGNLDAAFRIARRAAEEDPANVFDLWGPDAESFAIRQDQRFGELLRDNRLLELYRSRGWPDRCRPGEAEGLACE
ncbi:MAG: hypothetical protein GTN86_08080 [Xanthomonadales bacterium]|nr:hypothetical protein [Xanthomonadales bacterium]NIN59827.1 hypothetical protein [Xanthomonadales bacterium]NIN75202.1 hypothetical protein [Xanthomonadales bacterium]NIO13447.1 hypothetical protein [Xanthomonadales bacterium]NIP12220.1 hypothetical protein [Xanthomonadales bacterium]